MDALLKTWNPIRWISNAAGFQSKRILSAVIVQSFSDVVSYTHTSWLFLIPRGYEWQLFLFGGHGKFNKLCGDKCILLGIRRQMASLAQRDTGEGFEAGNTMFPVGSDQHATVQAFQNKRDNMHENVIIFLIKLLSILSSTQFVVSTWLKRCYFPFWCQPVICQ